MAATTVVGSSRSIAHQIRSRILASGPIPVADYMRLALTQMSSQPFTTKSDLINSRSEGYYMKKDVFGREGDFITSPEITQMFGELVGVWGVQCWRQLRGPSQFNVVELGPGRGTLSKDMLRVFQKFSSAIGTNVSLNLVEISPYLSKKQYETLCSLSSPPPGEKLELSTNSTDNPSSPPPSNAFQQGFAKETAFPISWYTDIREVPKAFSLYVAHEFFDALPVHKLQKVDGDWKEILVDISPEQKDGFRYVISRHETPALKVIKAQYPKLLDASPQHLEISLDALVILEELTSRLEEFGGIAVIIDYGHNGTKEDTFRAFRKHQLHDPLVEPGTADLTADVDFSIIKQLFNDKALICGPVSQHDFLGRVGIDLRLDNLMQAAKTEIEREQLQSGYKMIMNEMGTRFHFMSMFPKVLEQFLPRLRIAGFHK